MRKVQSTDKLTKRHSSYISINPYLDRRHANQWNRWWGKVDFLHIYIDVRTGRVAFGVGRWYFNGLAVRTNLLCSYNYFDVRTQRSSGKRIRLCFRYTDRRRVQPSVPTMCVTFNEYRARFPFPSYNSVHIK